MAKKIDYAALYTLRKDGRYMATYTDTYGKRHFIYDRDSEALHRRMQELSRAAEEPPPTFQEVADAWAEMRFGELSYKTVEAYKPVFRRVTARFGSAALGDTQTREIAAYLASLAQEGYAKRTVQLHRDMISQIYTYAIGQGLIQYNPCDHVQMPRGLEAGTRGIASDEAIEAVRHGLDKPFGLFGFLLLYSGLRRGEALALRHEDIDRSARLIHVSKSVQYIGNRPTIKEPKTKNSRRDVILLDVLAAAIPKGSGYLFPGADGGPLTQEAYKARWDRYCKAIGHHITAHQLRHGYATMLYEAGIGDKDAQEQLGHANITLTRDVYTHIRKGQAGKTAARLNRFVAGTAADEDEQIVRQILSLLEGRNAGEIMAKVAAALAAEKE